MSGADATEREENRIEAVDPAVEVLDARPIDQPEDPEDHPVLQALLTELEFRRALQSPQYLDLGEAYWLGWGDAIAYLRELTSDNLEVYVVQIEGESSAVAQDTPDGS